MKKQFFYAALAIALMSSCSKDNDPGTTTEPTNPTPEVIDDTTPAVIRLGINSPTVAATRGTGSVGDVAGNAANVWRGQALQVLMVTQGTMKDAQDNNKNIFDGETFTAPEDNSSLGLITFNTGNVKYYPMQGKLDFYGYHMDTNPDPVEDRSTEGSIVVTGTIDGTNDIMAATTRFSSEDSVKLINSALKAKGETYEYEATSNTITRNDNKTAITDAANSEDKALLDTELAKAYSSYAARRGVQPTLIFKHLMSRLKFHVRAGEEKAGLAYYTADKAITGHYFPTFDNENVPDGEYEASVSATFTGETPKTDGAVYIKSIKVTGQKSGVSLTFTPTEKPVLVGTGEATAEFTLMQRDTEAEKDDNTAKDLIALTPIAPANATAGDATAVGENMMILANESSFDIEIKVMQYVMTNNGQGTGSNTPVYRWKVSSLKTTVNAPSTMPNPAYTEGGSQPKSIPSEDKDTTTGKYIFAAGKSYNINVTVYGNQPIEVTAELTGWIAGDDVEVNPEDDEFNKVNP